MAKFFLRQIEFNFTFTNLSRIIIYDVVNVVTYSFRKFHLFQSLLISLRFLTKRSELSAGGAEQTVPQSIRV